MNNTTNENLPKSDQQSSSPTAENQIDKLSFFREIGIGFLGNIIWEIAICVFAPLVGVWKDVLPPYWVFVLIALGSLVLSYALRHYFKKLNEYHSYAHYLRYAIIMVTVVLGLVLFMTCCQMYYDSRKGVDISVILKALVAMAVVLSVLIVNTMYVSHMYRNIRRNKQQIDIREKNEAAVLKQSTKDMAFIEEKSALIMNALEQRSEEFNKALMKKDNDTAITATIIPFKVENNLLITYLMDNVASYKSYSWMFAGGHVKSAENEAPDAIAVSRAKTELGLTVKILNAPVVQDEMIDNMMAIVRPNYVYRFLNRDAKCFLEHGHEYHMDLVYLGEIQAVNDENILHKCMEIKIPFDKKYDQSFLISKCNEAKNSYYRSSRVKQKAQRNIPDYVFNMLFAAYNDYYDFVKG